MSYSVFDNNTGLYVDLGAGNTIDPYTQGFAIVAWVHRDAAGWDQTALDTVVQACDAVASNVSSLQMNCSISGVKETVGSRDESSTSQTHIATFDWGTNVGTGTYAGKWVVMVSSIESESSRSVYIENATNKTTQTNAHTDIDPFQHIYIGTASNGFSAMTQTGDRIAHVAIFNRNLTGTEIDALQTADETGVPPPSVVSDGSCVHYWTLDGSGAADSLLDQIGSADLVAQSSGSGVYQNGNSPTDNPIILSGPTITDVANSGESPGSGTETWTDGATGNVITGTTFV
jgi:hypothetical protein